MVGVEANDKGLGWEEFDCQIGDSLLKHNYQKPRPKYQIDKTQVLDICVQIVSNSIDQPALPTQTFIIGLINPDHIHSFVMSVIRLFANNITFDKGGDKSGASPEKRWAPAAHWFETNNNIFLINHHLL